MDEVQSLIWSDSDKEEFIHEFSKSEDRLLWMSFEELGFNDEVSDAVGQFVGGSRTEIQHGEPAKDSCGSLSKKIYQMKMQIQEERVVSIKEKLQRNGENLQSQVSALKSIISDRDSSQAKENKTCQMLSLRIDHPASKLLGLASLSPSGEKDRANNREVPPAPAPTIKIPSIERLPPYTTWMYLAKNEKMTEDQTIVGRSRIYYEKHGGEALVCSDSDEEVTKTEEFKHEFSEGEDQLLWMAFEEHGFNDEVLNSVREFVGGSRTEIQERYENLKKKNMGRQDQHSEDSGGDDSHIGTCLQKRFSAALDSFDNLFCRRCFQLFDCPLHGSSQPLIYPSDKQPPWSEPQGDKKPCSDHCYLLLQDDMMLSENSTPGSSQSKKTAIEEADGILTPSNAEEPINQSTEAITQEEICSTKEVDCCEDLNANVPVSESVGKRKVTSQSDSVLHESTLLPDDSQYSSKKLKIISDDLVTGSCAYNRNLNLNSCSEEKHTGSSAYLKSSVEDISHKIIFPGSIWHGEHDKDIGDGQKDDTNETELKLYNSMVGQVNEKPSFSDWKPLEKELYLKGVEIFGRNSCLIARNLLSGLKTCMEVASYMWMPQGSIPGPVFIVDENGRISSSCTDQKMSRARMLWKRGKTRKLKYSLKSAGLPSAWKRMAYGKNRSRKQYTPCECQGMCGKQCPCHNNETCCEKYCGCSKLCKYRFRGCHCAKSQCRSRQCPCFAAGRECDPDVCRNCWISCGDGSLGEPPRRGDGQCGNMNLLLRNRERILLAKSDVIGWGAFIKNPVNKHDYLGEYTGELISHREADKRGKLYDCANSSFLFNLNDQLVLDPYRKGDKLKFANHSYSANCYAKVMLVAGDHRVGIFANEHIDAGEELFYDYCYRPEQTPLWARKLEGYKGDESEASQGRDKKHQSH